MPPLLASIETSPTLRLGEWPSGRLWAAATAASWLPLLIVVTMDSPPVSICWSVSPAVVVSSSRTIWRR